MLLIAPLAGCDEEDFFADLDGLINEIENVVEDLDDDHLWDWWWQPVTCREIVSPNDRLSLRSPVHFADP